MLAEMIAAGMNVARLNLPTAAMASTRHAWTESVKLPPKWACRWPLWWIPGASRYALENWAMAR
jgi:hypothetical protein